MHSRELVCRVFEGLEVPRIPLHVESDSKEEEAALGDVVGVGAKFREWRSFYEAGGPFARRSGEKLLEWADRVEVDSYDWPDVSEVVDEGVKSFESRAREHSGTKFIIYKVLGPTETAESFFAEGVRERRLEGQVLHRYGFAVFLKLRPERAAAIYDKIAEYVLELAKAGAELDYVDAVRIADDCASYGGPLYPPEFLEEKYARWHEEFARAVERRGKYPVLHCDGDLRKVGIAGHLSRVYRGLHPLDLSPKSTLKDALEWVEAVAEFRERAGEAVFFTGLPVDLIFEDSVGVEEFAKVPGKLLELHGPEGIVLATTHSPYPGRSYGEPLPRRKIERIREIAWSTPSRSPRPTRP